MIRFLTAGESHGKGLTGILEGIPAGLRLSPEDIDRELKRRQLGYGRGGRMKIEQDRAEILSGVRWGKTIGSPISLFIENRDWQNWSKGMSVEAKHDGSISPVIRPRPGHADLAGVLKYDHKDIRNILERSSARETAMKVAVGAIAKKFLAEFGILIGSYVIQIGNVRNQKPNSPIPSFYKSGTAGFELFFKKTDASPVRCPDEKTSKQMVKLIDRAALNGDTLGGIFEVIVNGIPPGIGSHIQWDKRLDACLAQAIMGIQAVKGVEIGTGFEMAGKFGSEVMDKIFYRDSTKLTKKNKKSLNLSLSASGGTRYLSLNKGFYRKTNNAGGIEGGMTNGMPVVIKGAMKPIPTLKRPLHSVEITTKKSSRAAYERSDTCAVPAAGVIAEAMAALVIAGAVLEKFGGDNIRETKRNFAAYLEYLREY